MCCVLGPSCRTCMIRGEPSGTGRSRAIGIQDGAHRSQWREREREGEGDTQVWLVIRAMGGGFRDVLSWGSWECCNHSKHSISVCQVNTRGHVGLQPGLDLPRPKRESQAGEPLRNGGRGTAEGRRPGEGSI